MVNQVCTAISMAHRAANLENPTNTDLMMMFKKGLINIRTKRAQKKATPVDQEKLNELFLNWEDNGNLSNEDLRRKALALCSFVGMLHPSDSCKMKQSELFFCRRFRIHGHWSLRF